MKNANPLSSLPRLLILAALIFAGCGAGRPAAPAAPAPPPKSVADYFSIRVGDRTVRMQAAVLEPEMERGLMERRDLGPDDGMIFVYRAPQAQHFWMHDTPTALDVGFFTPAGELAEIYPMQPFDERTISSQRSDLQFALEMNLGWFARNGVKPGARLDLAALATALKARGFEPAAFGIRDSAAAP